MSEMVNYIKRIKNKIIRLINYKNIDYNVMKRKKNQVNLQYCNRDPNIGDLLSKVIVDYMLRIRMGNQTSYKSKKISDLYAIGSILDFSHSDGVVWGSGLLSNRKIDQLEKDFKKKRKLDIRALRGPRTKKILEKVGYKCPDIFGDPAIILPLIYNPLLPKEYDISIIQHINSEDVSAEVAEKTHRINVETSDYNEFVDEIKKSKKIISSSLHGIILSEAYGIPAVFVNNDVINETMKFYDWYESTGRFEFPIASNFDIALKMECPELPKLERMQKELMNAFPYDIFDYEK